MVIKWSLSARKVAESYQKRILLSYTISAYFRDILRFTLSLRRTFVRFKSRLPHHHLKPRKHDVCEVFCYPKSPFGLYFGPYFGKTVGGRPVCGGSRRFFLCFICALPRILPFKHICHDIARSSFALRKVMRVRCQSCLRCAMPKHRRNSCWINSSFDLYRGKEVT